MKFSHSAEEKFIRAAMLFYFKKRLTRFGRDFSCFSSQNLSLASGNFPEIT